jgi:hypothetical protein
MEILGVGLPASTGRGGSVDDAGAQAERDGMIVSNLPHRAI